jgi:raffinose/stachyose/melibiose transport system permease protein
MTNYINKSYPYTMLIPGLLLFFVFFIAPTFVGIYYSFQYWDLFTSRFAGLDNFISILTNEELKTALPNTIIFAVITTVFKICFGLILALFLNKHLRSTNYLRTIFFLPAVLNNVAVGLIFSAVLYPTGILNGFLQVIGLDSLALNWLTDTKLAIYSVSFIEVWKWTGFTMIIFLAGLQSISKDCYEAADIDGANGFQKFRLITFPLMMPSFNNALVICIIGGLRVFDIVAATTQGGPGNASMVLNTIVYRDFGKGYFGEATAANLMLGLLIIIIISAIYPFLRRREIEL